MSIYDRDWYREEIKKETNYTKGQQYHERPRKRLNPIVILLIILAIYTVGYIYGGRFIRNDAETANDSEALDSFVNADYSDIDMSISYADLSEKQKKIFDKLISTATNADGSFKYGAKLSFSSMYRLNEREAKEFLVALLNSDYEIELYIEEKPGIAMTRNTNYINGIPLDTTYSFQVKERQRVKPSQAAAYQAVWGGNEAVSNVGYADYNSFYKQILEENGIIELCYGYNPATGECLYCYQIAHDYNNRNICHFTVADVRADYEIAVYNRIAELIFATQLEPYDVSLNVDENGKILYDVLDKAIGLHTAKGSYIILPPKNIDAIEQAFAELYNSAKQ